MKQAVSMLAVLVLALPVAARAQESPTPATTTATTTQAQPFPDFYGFELGLGVVKPQDEDAALGWLARVNMGEVTPNIYLVPGVEYWAKSSSALGTKVSLHDLTVGAEVRYPFGSADLKFYAGAGAAMHFLSSKVESGGTETSDSKSRFGADLLGGVQLQASKTVGWFGEAKYRFVKDFGSLRFFGGLRWSP